MCCLYSQAPPTEPAPVLQVKTASEADPEASVRWSWQPSVTGELGRRQSINVRVY